MLQNCATSLYYSCKQMTTCEYQSLQWERIIPVCFQSKPKLMFCCVETLRHVFRRKKIAFKTLHLRKPFNQQLLSWSNVYTDLSTLTLCIMLAVPRSLEPSRQGQSLQVTFSVKWLLGTISCQTNASKGRITV